MTDRLTLHDALLGGPGLEGYAYNGSLYCVDCGRALIEQTFATVGDARVFADLLPSPVFFGESDTREHCDDCGEYLYGGKSIADFIDEHRTELYNAIWRQVPNAKLDDDDVEQWIANDEGLYQWAKDEGVDV